MRLRTIMTIVFCLSALVPMLLFWIWPNSGLLRNERQSAKEYHLLLSKSVAAELAAYYNQLTDTFSIIARQITLPRSYEPEVGMLKKLGILHVCLADSKTGEVGRAVNHSTTGCPEKFTSSQMSAMREYLQGHKGGSVVTPLIRLESGLEVFLVLYEGGENIVVGRVTTDYVTTVGLRNRFGIAGHTAILDRRGSIISHPNNSENLTLDTLGGRSMFERAVAGGNGVGGFYSPLYGEELIAGFAHSSEPGWSVLVSQPISELETKVSDMKYTSLAAMGIGLFVAVLLAAVATKLLTFPIIQMVHVMEKIGNGQLRAYENMQDGRFQPLEFHRARDSIRAMAEKLRENIDTISQHAYLDGITGLPNRECFKVLAQEEIERLGLAGQKGALLFLDLDGFKQVNDVYGHRCGDDLLKEFAQKIHVYCGSEMQRRASGVDNAINILPARLGGDEFVIFLGNIRNAEVVSDFASGLFRRVFGKFELHNGITLQVNGSVGGAMFPRHGSDFDELLRLADIAMYQAKKSGKGQFCMHQLVDNFAANEARLAFELEAEETG